jgi:hypothetical protein
MAAPKTPINSLVLSVNGFYVAKILGDSQHFTELPASHKVELTSAVCD